MNRVGSARIFILAALAAICLALTGCGGGTGSTVAGPPALLSSGGSGTPPPAADPTRVPSPPETPPPAVGAAPPAEDHPGAVTVPIDLAAGWNLISFPLATLESATGFTHQLYTYTPSGYTTVDPVADPGGVDTTRGYWAYAVQPTTVTVTGEANSGQVNAAALAPGWNLLGCPASTALPWRNITATRQGGITRVIEQATSADVTAGQAWLYRFAFGYTGSYTAVDLQGDTSQFQPRQGLWLFAWQEVDLNLNVSPPQPPPSITALVPSTVAPGDVLEIQGSGFGTAATGMVSLAGVPVPPSAVLFWSAGQVRLTVPGGAASGPVVVLVNRFPSNRVPLTVTGGGTSGGSGVIEGRVEDVRTGSPISGAQILVDTGQFAVSGADGGFRIDSVPAGDHLVYASRLGYQTAAGNVTVRENDTVRVLVQLTPSGGGGGGGGGEEEATLLVTAYPYEPGGERFWVYRIEVHEWGNYSNRWSDTWWSDLGEVYYELSCSPTYIGRTYVVNITWRNQQGDELSNSWYVDQNQVYQVESFYNPYSDEVERDRLPVPGT